MILEWDNPWELQTPEGNLPFNSLASDGTTPLGYYLLDRTKCHAGTGRRVTRTNIPQADGEIIHRKFKTGYALELHLQLWDAQKAAPACGGLLREMGDLLALHLNSIENVDGRIVWTPSADPDGTPVANRMVDSVRFLGPSGDGGGGFASIDVEMDPEGPLVVVSFGLLSQLPYEQDEAQVTTDLTAGATIFNGGDTEQFPVIRVYGPTNTFTLTNTDALDEDGDPLAFVYDASLPGAHSIASGHYAEIITFRNTIYLDGNSTNLKSGIDIPSSDFWPIVPGTNVITVGGGYTGSRIDLLWQNAYS